MDLKYNEDYKKADKAIFSNGPQTIKFCLNKMRYIFKLRQRKEKAGLL